MEYTFRLTGLHPAQILRLTDDALEVLDEARNRQRSVPWREVRKIRQHNGPPTADPARGPFPSKYCRVFTLHGSVDFRNGYHLHSVGKMGDAATDLTAEYDAFLGELLARLAAARPETPVISGWLLASLCWWGVAMLGVGCLAFAVLAYFYDPLLTALGLSLFFLPIGVALIFSGYVYGTTYWPRKTTVGSPGGMRSVPTQRSMPGTEKGIE